MDKFGTYLRDGTTGLDYADQRYFSGLSGRFLTVDPFEGSGGTADPSSWNRVAYVGGDPVNKVDPTGQRFWWADSLEQFEVGITTSGGWAGGGGGWGGSWWGCQATGFTGASFCGLMYDLSGAILAVMPPPTRSKVGRECRQAVYYNGVQTSGGLLDTANHSILALEYRDEYDDGSYISGFASASIEGTSAITWWLNPSTAITGMPVTVGLSLVITLDAAIRSPEQGGYFAGANTPWTGANCATNAGIASHAAALRDGRDILYFGAFTNSNSLISTLLANAGVSLAAPPNTPGWGNSLLYAPAGSVRLYRWP